MKLRRLYMLAALLLGSLLALAVAAQVFAVAAGVSWLYLFGDDPWPPQAQWYLTAIPLAAGLATVIASLVFGYIYGRGLEASPQPERARRRAILLLMTGAGLWLALLVFTAWQHERKSEMRAEAAGQEAAFRQLMEARHVITTMQDLGDGRSGLWLSLTLEGSRRGAYRLTWRLDELSFDAVLLSGEQHLELDGGTSSAELVVDAETVGQRYGKTVLQGRDDRVLVDGSFRLKLSLEPLLTSQERQSLPDREIGNIERGFSGLRFETEADVSMELDLTRP